MQEAPLGLEEDEQAEDEQSPAPKHRDQGAAADCSLHDLLHVLRPL